jgi:hypothetical protein
MALKDVIWTCVNRWRVSLEIWSLESSWSLLTEGEFIS